MKARCIFHFPGQRQFCEVLRTLRKPPMSGETARYFKSTHCTTDHFTFCPIFEELKHHPAEIEPRFDEFLVA
jgi:hypothetical protein